MNATPPGGPRITITDGPRFALGALTVLPVRGVRWDRAAAGVGMAWAPVAGLVVGAAAAAVAWFLGALDAGPALTAVLTAAVPATLSRGLHLDGLADVVDALGSGRPAGEALRIMKRSDIGPFGVVTLVFALAAQVAALAEAASPPAAALVAALVSRAALTWACRASGPPPARPEGLGATVARAVPVPAAVLAVAAACAVAAGVGAAADGLAGALAACCAAVLALSAAEALLRHCQRRFGGVTGDVLGAAAEVAATVALVTLAVTTG
ncbi:adenosylcobinamide-GDP ribazoletransferase [Streptomyces sp. 8K308]|uniref:adenosylcobinamide-GDP ribazoletransferase n=1 Tax=Streptomyces sp. 8K308 TaxID=2530388 RepID=UPI00104C14EE|nr:adenosylcobinamide-GDP ribazoletransferase [Streptomyces sp. 8K308]TDC19592.1 adenosylcobinamide-GDP ribazoletransferase [Streptomyces sp. 8K308]